MTHSRYAVYSCSDTYLQYQAVKYIISGETSLKRIMEMCFAGKGVCACLSMVNPPSQPSDRHTIGADETHDTDRHREQTELKDTVLALTSTLLNTVLLMHLA